MFDSLLKEWKIKMLLGKKDYLKNKIDKYGIVVRNKAKLVTKEVVCSGCKRIPLPPLQDLSPLGFYSPLHAT